VGYSQLAAVVLVAAMGALALVATSRWHARWTGDFAESGIQKHHVGNPPRVGLLALWLALGGFAVASAYFSPASSASLRGLLLAVALASLPVVLLGLADDVTKRITPTLRLLGSIVAGLLAIAVVGTSVGRIDLPLLGYFSVWAPIAVLLTVLMVAGFTHAMNIVDGLNGLSSGLGVLMFGATAVVASQAGDTLVASFALLCGAALLGFLFVNFPRGRIFMGDGAAYFIGFALVQAWMLLLARNLNISVWFVVAVAAHPTMETLFSIYRRRLQRGRGKSITAADRLHLHTLVYRRWALNVFVQYRGHQPWVPNAAASLRILGVAALPMGAAMLAPGNALWCLGVALAYATGYVIWFRRLVCIRQVAPEQEVSIENVAPVEKAPKPPAKAPHTSAVARPEPEACTEPASSTAG